MNREGYRAHSEAYQAIAKKLGAEVDVLRKRICELEAQLAEVKHNLSQRDEYASSVERQRNQWHQAYLDALARAEVMRAALESEVKNDS
jgi:hypothetical protein